MSWRELGSGRWHVSGYHDVVAALGHPALRAPGGGDATPVGGPRATDWYTSLPAAWQEGWRAGVRNLLARLDDQFRSSTTGVRAEVDLMHHVAYPCGVLATCVVLGMEERDVTALLPLARTVWYEAAMSANGRASPVSEQAVSGLARALGADAMRVQAFVALTHSVPALLGNVMATTLSPDGPTSQTYDPARMLTEEILRLAGPSTVVFREVAQKPTDDFPVPLEPGDVVSIDLTSANGDATVFGLPAHAGAGPSRCPHVTFGTSPHACLGAGTVRHLTSTFLDLWRQWRADQSHREVQLGRAEWERELETMACYRALTVYHA